MNTETPRFHMTCIGNVTGRGGLAEGYDSGMVAESRTAVVEKVNEWLRCCESGDTFTLTVGRVR